MRVYSRCCGWGCFVFFGLIGRFCLIPLTDEELSVCSVVEGGTEKRGFFFFLSFLVHFG